jgi:predicted lactoylglutathione lyase
MEMCNFNNVKANYNAFDIRIRNVKEYDDETELYVPLAISDVVELFKKDKESKYISERNADFLEETGMIKYFQHNDMFLRPPMVSSCIYDVMFASLNTETPLRYEINYRNYFFVTHGKVIVRLLPPKSTKYLYAINDYENFEFISPVNPWNVQEQYKADFNKLRSIDVTLMPGQLIHIPAYWWYSIKFVKSNTSICVFKYKTYMSTLSISDHLFMRILQRQNTKRVIAKRIVVKEKKNDEKTNDLTVSDENKVNNIDNKDDNINNKPIDNIQDSMATSSILKNDIGSEIVETIKTIETVELKDR